MSHRCQKWSQNESRAAHHPSRPPPKLVRSRGTRRGGEARITLVRHARSIRMNGPQLRALGFCSWRAGHLGQYRRANNSPLPSALPALVVPIALQPLPIYDGFRLSALHYKTCRASITIACCTALSGRAVLGRRGRELLESYDPCITCHTTLCDGKTRAFGSSSGRDRHAPEWRNPFSDRCHLASEPGRPSL